ncbi:serine/threonine-protein phosphatase 2A regulatory subunit B'' subunit gamma-like isoform X1 [Drosophila bipectinata]|uniref:serine/threonine-protein phosphatase 2A regulatory subunit B'' subunit gamma-like isoform X1 n=1 Tax=Drosophila bipectinata TaxID=42026 RepID=UPI001C8B00F3|nr:serine/threonine-protein phosphatase 2A regulatory subunit B'' subunit gamma-like isoform X1 [Drosophila bipectinata]
MEIDPELMEAFKNLQVSMRPISAEELAAFDEHTPLKERNEKQDHPSYSKIPRFFDPPPKPEDKIRQMMRREAHSISLQRQAFMLPDTDELNELWKVLQDHVDETTEAKVQLIEFDSFIKVTEKLGEKFEFFLRPRLFLSLMVNSPVPGKAEVLSIYKYVTGRVELEQGRIGISFYDEMGQGVLQEVDLENYIRDIIPTLAQVSNYLEPSFEIFYVCTVVKKFFFFLDPLHTGRIRIEDAIITGMLSEVLELRNEAKESEEKDDQVAEENEHRNWFSLESVIAVYDTFLGLDKDHNGLLSRDELAKYGSGTLTSVFMDRVFEVSRTFDKEMDYKGFLDFFFALEYRDKPPALHYLFRLLDVGQQGFLTAQNLSYFFEDIARQIKATNAEQVLFQDLKDEIFDMVKPSDPMKITVKDLLNSEQGETVVSILIEYQRFSAYENRDENRANI